MINKALKRALIYFLICLVLGVITTICLVLGGILNIANFIILKIFIGIGIVFGLITFFYSLFTGYTK